MGYSHLYITAHGEYTNAHWSPETSQIGIRVSRWGLVQPSPFLSLPNLNDWKVAFTEYDTDTFHVTSMFDSDDDTSLARQGITEDFALDMHAFLSSMRAHQWSGFRWTHIKVALIEHGTGKYLTPSSIYTFKSPLVGANASPFPPEVALALSWRTAVVGKRGRGRMYLPALSAVLGDASGTLDSSKRTTIVGQLKTLHDDFADLPGIDTYSCGVVICSANSTTAIIPKEARVGNHFDVQRRRQHQAEEAYTSLSVG